MKRTNTIVFFLLIAFTNVFGQSNRFQQITSKNGLSQSEVYSFLEDSSGFMWFGTLDGLNRYDGYNIITFNTEKGNPHSLSNNTIRSLAEDKYGRIWIGTDNGLCVYDSTLEKIFQIGISGYENLVLSIQSILIEDDILFLSTTDGLLISKLSSEKSDLIHLNFSSFDTPVVEGKIISQIIKAKDGSFWFSDNYNLYQMYLGKSQDDYNITKQLKSPRIDFTKTLIEDFIGNIWIMTENDGFMRFNPQTKKIDFHSKDSKNKSISTKTSSAVSDKNGNLWIGTRDKGLMFLDVKSLNHSNPTFKKIQHNPFNSNSINSNLIFSLYVSRNNIVWVGTIGSGINVFDSNQKRFDHYKISTFLNESESGSNFIRSVYVDANKNVWMGTHNNGLYLLNRDEKKLIKAGFGTNSVFYIENIGNDIVLFSGTSGFTVGKIENNKIKILQKDDENNATFYSCKSMDDIIWIASINGLKKYRYDNGYLKFEKKYSTTSNPPISFNNIRVLYYDKKRNELLAGTEGGGLNVLTLDKNHEVTSSSVYKKNDDTKSISNDYIRAITKDSYGDIWVGTYEGLNKINYDNENLTFESITKKEGLPSNMIQSLIEDDQKNLWIGTNGGLCKLDIEKKDIIFFSTNDGIQSNEFSEHTSIKTTDGEIIIGGINGINTFYPNKIIDSNIQPNTTITDFYIFGKKVGIGDNKEKSVLTKSIVLTDTIKLKPSQNSFSFTFSSLTYSNPEKIKFSYLLEGFDKNWNYTDSKNRIANYTNLDHGSYIFKVRSTNSDGEWDEQQRTIFIDIKTPFIYSNFAFALYIIIIIAIFIYLTNYTIIKYTTKKEMVLANQHNQKLVELDELRTRFFINISHDLRTPLTLIGGPLKLILKNEKLKESVRNQLELIQLNVNKLSRIMEQLLDIRKAETGKLPLRLQKLDIISFIKRETDHFSEQIKIKGLELTFFSSKEKMITCIDTDKISKVLFNILGNAIKFTERGKIDINISKVHGLPKDLNIFSQKEFVFIEVKDTGIGIKKENLEKITDRFFRAHNKSVKGYGVGLSHSKKLVEAHDGFIHIKSKINQGTSVQIYIPLLDVEGLEISKVEEKLENLYLSSTIKTNPNNELPNNKNGTKILLIEDNIDLIVFLRNELKKKYEVLVAYNGIEGCKMAEKYSPDLIISDIMMPKMDGIEFCKKIKSDIKTSHIQVILLTARAGKESKIEGIEMGADDYITKPFDIEYLILRIENLLKSKERIRKSFQLKDALIPNENKIKSLDEIFIEKLMDKINHGISNPEFKVSSLEKEMGMSHSNFYRKIKNITGLSGKEILIEMRMKKAKQILTNNKDIRVSEVAFMVGFLNPKYFSKTFKEYFGVNPSKV